jgi:hypothetical protein
LKKKATRRKKPPSRDPKLVAAGKCGRRKKANRGYCGKPAPAPGRACRLHGGNAPKGVEHWNYQGKGYSDYDTPESISATYKRFLADTDISLRADIALTRTMIQAALDDLGAGVAGGWREAISAVHAALEREVGKGPRADPAAFRAALGELGGLVEQGARVDHAAAELRQHQKMLRDMVDTEVRRLKFDGAPAEEVIAYSYQLMQLFRDALREVAAGATPGRAEAAMMDKFRALVGHADPAEVN